MSSSTIIFLVASLSIASALQIQPVRPDPNIQGGGLAEVTLGTPDEEDTVGRRPTIALTKALDERSFASMMSMSGDYVQCAKDFPEGDGFSDLCKKVHAQVEAGRAVCKSDVSSLITKFGLSQAGIDKFAEYFEDKCSDMSNYHSITCRDGEKFIVRRLQKLAGKQSVDIIAKDGCTEWWGKLMNDIEFKGSDKRYDYGGDPESMSVDMNMNMEKMGIPNGATQALSYMPGQ